MPCKIYNFHIFLYVYIFVCLYFCMFIFLYFSTNILIEEKLNLIGERRRSFREQASIIGNSFIAVCFFLARFIIFIYFCIFVFLYFSTNILMEGKFNFEERKLFNHWNRFTRALHSYIFVYLYFYILMQKYGRDFKSQPIFSFYKIHHQTDGEATS